MINLSGRQWTAETWRSSCSGPIQWHPEYRSRLFTRRLPHAQERWPDPCHQARSGAQVEPSADRGSNHGRPVGGGPGLERTDQAPADAIRFAKSRSLRC